MKKGFTLSELLISLTVVGIIVAILTPVAKRLLPNENILRTKKAFHIANVILNDMLNDENCYPKTKDFEILKDDSGNIISDQIYFKDDGTPRFPGLNNPYKYPNCKGWSGSGDEYDSDGNTRIKFDASEGETNAECRAGRKFIEIFMDKLDCTGQMQILNSSNIPAGDAPEATECYKQFFVCRTKDKMTWSFRNSRAGGLYAYVDVNGPEKPNHRDHGSRAKLPMWDFDYNNGAGGMYYVDIILNTEVNSKRPHDADFYDTFRINFDRKTGKIEIYNESAKDAIYNSSEFNRF